GVTRCEGIRRRRLSREADSLGRLKSNCAPWFAHYPGRRSGHEVNIARIQPDPRDGFTRKYYAPPPAPPPDRFCCCWPDCADWPDCPETPACCDFAYC